MERISAVFLLACISAGCGHQTQPDCAVPPCALPLAITVTVTSAAGGPVSSLTLTLSGAVSGSGPCGIVGTTTVCTVLGGQGTYNLLLTAAGFQDQKFTVTVPGAMPPCQCPTVQAQQVNVVLTPK